MRTLTYQASLLGREGPKALYVVAPVDLGPMGAQARGNEPGRL